MNRQFVTCFRDVVVHIIAVSRTLHSSNCNVLWLRNTENGRFESSAIVFEDAIYSVITTSPLYLYTVGHGPTDFLNCDNSRTQDEKLEIMIIRNCLPCTLRLYELNFNNNNKFCNVFLNSIDKRSLRCYCYIQNVQV